MRRGFPFWMAAVSALFGVAVSEFVHIGMWGTLWIFFMGVLLYILSRSIGILHVGTLCLVASISFGVGTLRGHTVSPVRSESLDALLHQEITITGKVVSELDERESSARVVVSAQSATTKTTAENISGLVLAIIPAHQAIAYGDTVSLTGVLGLPERFDTDTGRVFDYPAYLSARGVGYTLSFAQVDVIEQGGWNVYRALFGIKSSYVGGLGQALVEPHAALAAGITVGDKRALGGKLLNIFRDAGVVHIIVLSGYNITIIIAAVMWFLQSRSRKVRAGIGVAAIALFVIMTGAGAASVRAGVMGGISLLALLSYRTYAVSRALAVSAVAMVFYNPPLLLHDVGFQLSVVATLGLIFLTPHVSKNLGLISEKWGLREIIATTIGTQIAVLPLLAYYMGTVSLVSLLVNVLVLPVVPFAMLVSFIAGVVGMCIGGVISMIVGYPAYLLLGYMLFISERAASLPFATVGIPEVSLWFVVGVYVAGALLLVYVQSAIVGVDVVKRGED